MAKKSPGMIKMQVEVPESLHADLKIAAVVDGRSMAKFILEAIKERVSKFRQGDIESPRIGGK